MTLFEPIKNPEKIKGYVFGANKEIFQNTGMRKDCYCFEGVYHYPTPDYRNHFTQKGAETAKENYTGIS